MPTRFPTKLAAAFLVFIATTLMAAEIEEGKVGKYFSFDPEKGVEANTYPELTLDDLRKITLYSKLLIRGRAVRIADDEHMRSITPHRVDRQLLVVTSDRFRFTTFANGAVPPKGLRATHRRRLGFLWIKHATREEAPDGKPALKDLILLPYNRKTGKLLGPWPLDTEIKVGARKLLTGPLFITLYDERPDPKDFPPLEECVAGTFRSGKYDYLVIDVFGGYGWHNRIGWTEYLPLRGKGAAQIDAFHAPPGRSQFVRLPSGPGHTVMDLSPPGAKKLLDELPALLGTKVRSEPSKGWEDLLVLEGEGRPVKAIDDMIQGFGTLGELVGWASTYYDKHNKGSTLSEWMTPLDQALARTPEGHITSMRVLRYAFRRLGFPAVIQGVPYKKNLYPDVHLHVYLPSRNASFILPSTATSFGADVLRTGSSFVWNLPFQRWTLNGVVPVFDCHLGERTEFAMPPSEW